MKTFICKQALLYFEYWVVRVEESQRQNMVAKTRDNAELLL